MNNSMIIKDEVIREHLKALSEVLTELGIASMLQLAIDLELVRVPRNLNIIVGDYTNKTKTTYNIFYTHNMWGNVKILAGSGKYKEYLIHSAGEEEQPYYILRRIADSVNSSLANLAISADLVLAQFSSDLAALRSLASYGDNTILDVLQYNPNITDDIRVMIQLRK